MTINVSKILAVIPARSGSKGVVKKNTRFINGRRLYEYSVLHALGSDFVAKVVVSTDDSTILKERFMEPAGVKYLPRPSPLAGDASPSSEYLKHAIEVEGAGFENVVILQPTSPFRLSEDIDHLVRLALSENAKFGVTVCDVPHQFTPSSLLKEVNERWCCDYRDAGGLELDRNKKEKFLARNGAAVYFVNIKEFMETGRVVGSESVFYKMPYLRSIDIDTEDDMTLAKLLMEAK